MKTTRWVPRPPNDPPIAPDAGLHAELFVQLAAQAGLQVFVGLPVPARQERVRLPVRPDDEHVVGVANHGAGEEVGSRHRGRTRICDEEDLRRRGDDSATISVPLCDPVSVLASPHVLRPSRCLAALDLATRARGPHFVAVPMMCGDTGGTPMLKRSIVIEEKPACCRCAPVRRSGRQPSATAFQRGRMPC